MSMERRHSLLFVVGLGSVLLLTGAFALALWDAPLQNVPLPERETSSTGRTGAVAVADPAADLPGQVTISDVPVQRQGVSQRRVSFVPRCAVLSNAKRPVLWSTHVEVRSSADLVARQDLPAKRFDLWSSSLAESLAVCAPGYRRTTAQVPAGERDHDLGEVLLQPDARIRVTVSGLPAVSAPWLTLRIEAQQPGPERSDHQRHRNPGHDNRNQQRKYQPARHISP